MYKVATAAILIQTRGVQSVFSLEKEYIAIGAKKDMLLATFSTQKQKIYKAFIHCALFILVIFDKKV